MKGVRFYEQFQNKRKGVSAGQCVALMLDDHGRPVHNDDGRTLSAVAGVFEHADSPPASTSVSFEFLRTKCKRVTEARARKIHPRLFTMLDD